MNLDERHLDAGERVSECHAGVRVGSGVDDDRARAVQPGSVDAVEKSTLVIGLEAFKVHSQLVALLSCLLLDIRQRHLAIPVPSNTKFLALRLAPGNLITAEIGLRRCTYFSGSLVPSRLRFGPLMSRILGLLEAAVVVMLAFFFWRR